MRFFGTRPQRLRRTIIVTLALCVVVGGVLGYRLLARPSLTPFASLQMQAATPNAGDLRVRFMGTTTVLLEDGQTSLLVDGFFSRPSLGKVFFRSIAPDKVRIDDAFRRAGITQLAAIMTAHSHYDHAMDAAEIARRTGAMLIGSGSTRNIGLGANLPEGGVHTIHGGETLTFGRFHVRFFKSLHSPGGLCMGDIVEPLIPPRRVCTYKEGGSFTFLFEHGERRILVHPSTNSVPDMYRGVSADVVLLGIAAFDGDESFAESVWREVVRNTRVRRVIPIHWDDFFQPLDKDLKPMPRIMGNFELAMRRVLEMAQADGVTVSFLPPFEPVDVFTFSN